MESAQELALNTGASALRMAYTIFHDDVSIVDARDRQSRPDCH